MIVHSGLQARVGGSTLPPDGDELFRAFVYYAPTERQHHAVGWKEASFGAHTDVQRRVYPGQFKGESFLCTPTNGDDDYRTDSNTASAKMVIVDLPPCGHEARKRLKNRAGYIQKASTIDRSK